MSDLSLEDQNFDNRQTELIGQIDNGNDYVGDIILQVRPAMIRDAGNGHFPPFHAMTAIQGTGNATNGVGVGVEGVGGESGTGGPGIGLRGIGVNGGGGVVGLGSGAGVGVVGTGASGPGVQGESQLNDGVFGKSSSDGAGVRGECDTGFGVFGKSAVVGFAGVNGLSENGIGTSGLSTDGPGVYAMTTNNSGVIGISEGSAGGTFGVLGISASGVAVFGESLAGAGAGVEGLGKRLGVHGEPGDADGVGVYGFSQSHLGVSGFTDKGTAVSGVVAKPFPAGSLAGHFVGNVLIEGTLTKTGLIGALVPHSDGSHRLLCAIESPESWFEDFGKGRLVNGAAHIALDPDFAAVVDASEYHVFLTPYGDCNGLYVARLTPTSFAVRESDGGNSNVEFAYRLVARRKDVSHERLPKMTLPPVPQHPRRLESPPDPRRFRPRNIGTAPTRP
jgi:hypothetical protein